MDYFITNLLAAIFHMNLQFVFESFLIGILTGVSIYFFTKNKWGSIFITVPITSIYFYFVYNDILNYFYIFIGLLIQYIIITIIDKNLFKKIL